MRQRIGAELALLCNVYGDVQHTEVDGEDWFRLPVYPLPTGWAINGQPSQHAQLAFLVKGDYPTAAPYGFLLPMGLTVNGTSPSDTGSPPKLVPFPGDWFHFSWTVDNWQASNDVSQGSNLISWCRSFATRLREGA